MLNAMLNRVAVDLSALVNDSIADFRAVQPDRPMTVSVQDRVMGEW